MDCDFLKTLNWKYVSYGIAIGGIIVGFLLGPVWVIMFYRRIRELQDDGKDITAKSYLRAEPYFHTVLATIVCLAWLILLASIMLLVAIRKRIAILLLVYIGIIVTHTVVMFVVSLVIFFICWSNRECFSLDFFLSTPPQKHFRDAFIILVGSIYYMLAWLPGIHAILSFRNEMD